VPEQQKMKEVSKRRTTTLPQQPTTMAPPHLLVGQIECGWMEACRVNSQEVWCGQLRR
jgi:hypothetical protein